MHVTSLERAGAMAESNGCGTAMRALSQLSCEFGAEGFGKADAHSHCCCANAIRRCGFIYADAIPTDTGPGWGLSDAGSSLAFISRMERVSDAFHRAPVREETIHADRDAKHNRAGCAC
jgi:hypothetical protein